MMFLAYIVPVAIEVPPRPEWPSWATTIDAHLHHRGGHVLVVIRLCGRGDRWREWPP